MPRRKKPTYQMSMFKRSPFNDLLKFAFIDDFEFDVPPSKLEIVRFGTYKRVESNGSYAEYKEPKTKTRLRINL